MTSAFADLSDELVFVKKGVTSMTSIPDLTEKVKTAVHHPNIKMRKTRKRSARLLQALPFAATHIDAPTLPDVQQAAMGVFVRFIVAYASQKEGGHHGR